MSAPVWFLICSTPFVLVTFAWMCGRKASYHRGAADAFQQVSNDFRGLADATWFSDKAEKEAKRKKHLLNLCLCSPDVCAALEDAVAEARVYWNNPKEVAA